MRKPLAILTDSHSGILPEEAARIGVSVLSMPFTVNDQTFLESVSLSREAFFRQQAEGASISTSQPAPEAVAALWDEALQTHEQALYLPISSGLSGSGQTAAALAQEPAYAGRVLVVDNGRVATPLHRAVLDAVALRDEGHDAQAIKAALENSKAEMTIYVALQTLEYLKRGGRVSPAVAAIGTLLSIKPVLRLSTGVLESYKKCRGFAKAKAAMIEAVRGDLTIRFRDAHARGEVYLLAATSASQEETAQWLAEIEAAFPGMPVLCDPLSLGVCCHTGQGTLGIGLSCKPRLQGCQEKR